MQEAKRKLTAAQEALNPRDEIEKLEQLSAPARVCASLRQISGSAYSARETQHVGLVVEYASVASLWRSTKRRTPVAVAGRSVG